MRDDEGPSTIFGWAPTTIHASVVDRGRRMVDGHLAEVDAVY